MSDGRSTVTLANMARVHSTPAFLPEDLKQLMPVGVDLEEVAGLLNSAVAKYAIERRRNTSLDHRGVARQSRLIAVSTRKALNACGIVGSSEILPEKLYDGLGSGALFAAAAIDGQDSGADAVIGALRAIRDLSRWATVVQERSAELARLQPAPKPGVRPDTDFDRYMHAVAGIYKRYFLVDPVIEQASIGQDEDRKPEGAFFDLLYLSAKRLTDLGLHGKLASDALARRWWRYKGQNKSRNKSTIRRVLDVS